MASAIGSQDGCVSGSIYPWLGAGLALLACIPALPARGLIADDWTVYYAYYTEGAGSVAQMMREGAHTGYAVPMLLFLRLSEHMPNFGARLATLAIHLLNGFLLLRVLRSSPRTAPIADLTTALFLLSPFYAIRLTLNGIYDFFLVFYLLSYHWMDAKSRVLRSLAPVCLFFSLSLETLAALEPLRLLIAYRRDTGLKGLAAKLWPFWSAIAVVAGLRLTILGKSGHYTGQYSPSLTTALTALQAHLASFPRAISYGFGHGIALFGKWTTAALVVIVVAAAGAFRERLALAWLLATPQARRNALLLAAVGILVVVVGALPYAAVGIHADPTRGESRLAFPSQFGALILLAVLLQALPPAWLRSAAAALFIGACALSMGHDSKWLLYDGYIAGDILRQTRAALLADPTPKVVELRLEPASGRVFFRKRCLGANDLNVAPALLRPDGVERSFVYETNCGDFTNPDIVPRGRCPISYVDGFPCPAAREAWRYRLPDHVASVDRVGLGTLVSAALWTTGFPSDVGILARISGTSDVPLPRNNIKPPCARRGVSAALWLLRVPADNCY
jgi:hypothetical protein